MSVRLVGLNSESLLCMKCKEWFLNRRKRSSRFLSQGLPASPSFQVSSLCFTSAHTVSKDIHCPTFHRHYDLIYKTEHNAV